MSKPNIAIILGNAGIKSIAALPLIHKIKCLDAKISIIASGFGATMACLDELNSNEQFVLNNLKYLYDNKVLFKRKSSKTPLMIAKSIFSGKLDLTHGIYEEKYFRKRLQDCFNDQYLQGLRTPIFIQVTNVMTAESYLFDSGKLDDLLYATSALFPLFPPIQIGLSLYVDGVYSSAVPLINLDEKEHFDLIVVIGFQQNYGLIGSTLTEFFINMINRTFTIGQRAYNAITVLMKHHHSEILFVQIPFLENYSICDTSKLKDVLDDGHRYCDRAFFDVLLSYDHILKKQVSIFYE